ncbi:MAG: hypothetical protein IJF58_02525 [Clostridia bacterium]|nr:hypothetical protein [Clostridia bacterium]
MNSFQLITAAIGGFVIGGFCGSLSLAAGIVRKKLWIGILGLCFCIGFGVLMTTVFYQPAFLSLIPSGVIAALILLLTKKK